MSDYFHWLFPSVTDGDDPIVLGGRDESVVQIPMLMSFPRKGK